MTNWNNNIHFILVEPKEPGNIGAAARGMKNMGFRNLELVKPGRFLTSSAKKMAWNAFDLLGKAVVHSNLQGALKDKGLVIKQSIRGQVFNLSVA